MAASSSSLDRISVLSLKFLLLMAIGFLVVISVDGHSNYRQLAIKMPGARATQHDEYLCTSIPVNSDEEYIVRFEADATQEIAHHMILSGCKKPGSQAKIWKCGVMGGLECASDEKLLFAWAKNAPPKDLPKGVAFKIGKKTSIRYLVLQVHYKHKAKDGESDHSGFILHTTLQRQPFLAGIYLFWAGDADIAPNKDGVHVDLGCSYTDEYPIFAFAYRTHAHGLGRVISGYKIHDKKWSLIGKGDPQAPQAFYSIDKAVKISKGDKVAARCTFDGSRRHLNKHVHMGATGEDEMCNFYIMYYRDSKAPSLEVDQCSRKSRELSKYFPTDSDVALKASGEDELRSGSRKRILEDEPPNGDSDKLEIKMPGAVPEGDNAYLCTSIKLEDKEKYIVHYDPMASSNVAHHMLLFGCSEPGSDKKIWKCGDMEDRKCKGEYKVVYAWANDAPSKDLPKDVGFKIGKDSGINYLVLQMHYKHKLKDGVKDHSGLVMRTTTKRQKNSAGILVIWANQAEIPPETKGYHVDVGCKYEEKYPMYAFAYRAHAHSLGRVITGYKIHRKHWTLLGRGDPQAAQAFYPMNETVAISPGDLLVARCTYDTVGRGPKHSVGMGATGKDEMCNFYIMFYRDSKYEKRPIPKCTQKFHSDHFPADSDEPVKKLSASEGRVIQIPVDAEPKGLHGPADSPQGSNGDDAKKPDPAINKLQYQLVEGWPQLGNIKLGQVSAVALDLQGNVVVFHRGSRTWDSGSFDSHNVFNEDKPISEYTVISFDRKTGKIIGKWGQNMFYMPHGLTIDHKNNVWITDVALHQVRRYPPRGGSKPSLELGEMLTPGSDEHHFCKPTDVAVETSGVFYVADGYCNGRIMKFRADGSLLAQYGRATPLGFAGSPPLGTFDIPHSLALDQKHHSLYIADRENGRIQKMDTRSGTFEAEIYVDEFGTRVFAVDFNSHNGGVLHVVNGESVFGGKRITVQGFTVNTSDGSLISKWPGQGNFFTQPHSVASSPDNKDVFVTQIGPNRIWKLSQISYSMNDMDSHSDKLNTKDKEPSGHDSWNEEESLRAREHGSKIISKSQIEKPAEVDHHFGGDDGEKGGSQDEWLNALPSLLGKDNNNNNNNKEVEADLCRLPKDEGPCRAAMPRWYYSARDSTCHRFLYGGCQGNRNNFQTMEECLRACLKGKKKETSKKPESSKNDEDALKALGDKREESREDNHEYETPTTQLTVTEDYQRLAEGEDEGPESNIHYNLSSYPPYHKKPTTGMNQSDGNVTFHKLHKPSKEPITDEMAVGMIPALIILSVLAVPIVFLLLISIILRVRAYRRETRYKTNRLLGGKEAPGLNVSRTRGWCSYLNCCDRRKYGFDKVNLAEFYSDSDSEGV